MSTSRHLYVLAVRDYPNSPDGFAEGIDQQLRVVRDWWCAAELGERALTEQAMGPIRNRDDVEDVIRNSGLRDLGTGDVAVLYITGHGVPTPSGRHYLTLPDTPPMEHLAHGYPTADLITAILASGIEHLLVIINSCFAGTLSKELDELRKDLSVERRLLDSIALFASADFDEMPRVREFSDLLSHIHRKLRSGQGGYIGEWLSIDEFATELYYAHRELNLLQPQRLWRTLASPGPSRCLPNPGYQPKRHIVAAAREQVATDAEEMDYWLDRASGRLSATDPGWYFSGRRHLTTQVADFLHHGNGLLLITGAAGTGKSAIIARTVTLSDPRFRDEPRYAAAIASAPPETLPPPRSVDAAVLARNGHATDIAEQLIRALGATPTPATAPETRIPSLREQLLELTARGATLVLDGLDEATDPIGLITDLVGPLLLSAGDGHRLRLIIGVRSATPGSPPAPEPDGANGPDGAGGADSAGGPGDHDLIGLLRRYTDSRTELRTDLDTIDDITGYLAALTADRYTDHEPERDALVNDLARAVTPSFLDARFAGRRLRDSPTLITIDAPDATRDLHEGTIGLLRSDLTDTATDQHPASALLAALRATAFAGGAGLPFANIWPAVASAVLDAPVHDTTITHLLSSRLGGYLARDVADARVVFRPVHESLAETLRDHPERLTGEPDGH